jgi:signal transduction histidine kinase
VTPQKRTSSSAAAPPGPPDLQRITATVQHQLNNPLAALLAEAQLLRMEPDLSEAHGMAVDRMIDILRRIIALVRDLDRPAPEPGPR